MKIPASIIKAEMSWILAESDWPASEYLWKPHDQASDQVSDASADNLPKLQLLIGVKETHVGRFNAPTVAEIGFYSFHPTGVALQREAIIPLRRCLTSTGTKDNAAQLTQCVTRLGDRRLLSKAVHQSRSFICNDCEALALSIVPHAFDPGASCWPV